VGLLMDDLQGVPIIDQLEENVEIIPAVFQTRNGKQNIWIEII